MRAIAAGSAFRVDVARYLRSPSLWLLLLFAPIAARYMISEKEGEGINLAVSGQLPVLTSPVFGVWLGIVVSLLVMPVAFIYLRAGPTRRQPWQVEETTSASRIAIAMGRFGSDALIMVGILAALSMAGLFLAWIQVTGPWQPHIILALAWVIALPTLLATGAIRILFDAVPWLRGALGDFAFFMIWLVALIIPSLLAENPSSYGGNLASLSGAIRPLVDSAPPGSSSFAIGTSQLAPGRIELDPWRGISAEGYIASRLSWIGFAIAIAAFAGLVYRPHKPKDRRSRFAFLENLSLGNLLPRRSPSEQAAQSSRLALPNLFVSELRLIAGQNLFLILFVVAAAAGLADDFRKIGSPVQLLLMIFALTAYAGEVEQRGLRGLTSTMTISPWPRRLAFGLVGTALTTALALPASLIAQSLEPIALGAATGGVASLLAIGLAALSGSAFVPRIVLLIVWYGYFAG